MHCWANPLQTKLTFDMFWIGASRAWEVNNHSWHKSQLRFELPLELLVALCTLLSLIPNEPQTWEWTSFSVVSIFNSVWNHFIVGEVYYRSRTCWHRALSAIMSILPTLAALKATSCLLQGHIKIHWDMYLPAVQKFSGSQHNKVKVRTKLNCSHGT